MQNFRRHALRAFASAATILGSVGGVSAGNDEQPWRKAYEGMNATGSHVIALWQFLSGHELEDNSGNGHALTLRGASRIHVDGRFGACLESFSGGRENDKAHGATAKDHPSLTPEGAFTLEAWIRLQEEEVERRSIYILDKHYFSRRGEDNAAADCDYNLRLEVLGQGRYQLCANLGYGTETERYSSNDIAIPPGEWKHVAFTYDGQGTGRFFLDGKSVGKTFHDGREGVADGPHPLVIGDRVGSIHWGFPGYIDHVRICKGVVPFFSGSLDIDFGTGRSVFRRMERAAALAIDVENDTGRVFTGGIATVRMGEEVARFELPSMEPSGTHAVTVPIYTALRPGAYELCVSVSGKVDGRQVQAEAQHRIGIVSRPLPETMPVVMWGGGDIESLKRIGFTHHLLHLADYKRIWQAGMPTEAAEPDRLARLQSTLDQRLAEGIGVAVYVYPGRATDERFQRVDRRGQPLEHKNVCGLFPEVQAFCYNVGASVARSFGHHPALQASLIHSEIRDGTNLCFHQHDRDAFRRFAGRDIPKEAVSKNGVRYQTIPGFPAERVIPDDDPILTFYRWFWSHGDGWNTLHSQVHEGLKSTGRDDLWTWFDPAVRAPSVWGSGGKVDVISNWTYTYPDPIKIGQATDELFAMAEGAANDQQVMKMTQLIWKRFQTTGPVPEDEAKRAQWEKDIPDAKYYTIAPDHIREAFWSKISRPVRGIMYHGWGSLVPVESTREGGYVFTHPQTQEVLAELVHAVVRPLGPTLLQIPDRASDVAVLQSFTSQVFANRGPRGWSSSWEADMHLILQWAQIQPRIVFEETLMRDGLDDVRVLVMPGCDVLTQNMAAKIAAWQNRGGIVVSDEFLAPALAPDILIESRRRSADTADNNKAALQQKAADLRRELDGFYQRYGDSSNPDVVIRLRKYGPTDYLFAVNDKRTFGDYVGHHGKVMEKGLPASATLTVNRKNGFVYDLVEHSAIAFAGNDGALSFKTNLGPGDGRVFMITDRPIEGVRVTVRRAVRRGTSVPIDVRVMAGRRALRAVVPVHVEILDPEGRPAEFSGWYGAKDGRVALRFDVAPNDVPGLWTVKARELASGRTCETRFSVRP